jgi:hypothetical protein
VNFANLSNPQEFTDYYHYVTYRGKYAVHMELKPGLSGRTSASSRLQAASEGNYAVNNNVDFKVWDNADKNFVHVA